jgi:hypothetical protein
MALLGMPYLRIWILSPSMADRGLELEENEERGSTPCPGSRPRHIENNPARIPSSLTVIDSDWYGNPAITTR